MADAAASADVTSGPSWVGRALDGEGDWRLRSQAPFMIGLLMLFDSWDSTIIAYALPSIIAEWKLSALEAGSLVSAGYGGQFLGAILFGSVAERFGRLPVVRSLVVIMSLLAILCALIDDYGHMFAVRFIQGLAIGGAMPVAICYVNEIAPTATRGRFFGNFQFLMTSGFGLAALVSAFVIPAYGWRPVFAIGGLPLLILPFTMGLPESPRWLAARGRVEEAVRSLAKLGVGRGQALVPPDAADPHQAAPPVPFALLVAPGVRGKFFVAMTLWFLTYLVSFGLVTWMPSLYVSVFGLTLARALQIGIIGAIIVFILPLVLRLIIDRIGRRPPALLGTAVGGLALVAIAFLPVTAVPLVVTLAVLGGAGVAIGSMILWPYSAEIFDTRARSLALGTLSSTARGASMLTPLVVGGIMQATGSVMLVFLIFGGASLIAALLWLVATRETAGREIDG